MFADYAGQASEIDDVLSMRLGATSTLFTDFKHLTFFAQQQCCRIFCHDPDFSGTSALFFAHAIDRRTPAVAPHHA